MPITESEMTLEDMQKAEHDGLTCAVCGSGLSVAWGGYYGIKSNILRCGKDINHTGVRRDFELTPSNIPGFNLYDAGKKRRENMEKKYGEEKTKALAKYQMSALITRDAATEIINTLWQGAPPTEKTKAILLCATYNLNPLMNHLFMLPFKGKEGKTTWAVAIGIEATRLMARRKHHYTYLDLTPRKATQAELEKILGDEIDKDAIYQITKIKDLDTGAEAYGLGSWKGAAYGSDKGNTPSNMAAIRSERQALKRLYPAEMPAGVEVIDEHFIPPTDNGSIEGDYRVVDTVTGEITEAEDTDGKFIMKAPPAPAEPSQDTNPGGEKAEEAQSPARGALTLGKVLTWVSSHGKQYDRAWFFKSQSALKETEKPTERILGLAMSEICSLTGWDGI